MRVGGETRVAQLVEHVAGGFGSVVGNDYFHGVAFVAITVVIGVEMRSATRAGLLNDAMR